MYFERWKILEKKKKKKDNKKRKYRAKAEDYGKINN